MLIRKILNRIYSDFMMPCRLSEYKAIQQLAIANGYEMHSVKSFLEIINNGLDKNKKYFINRHDIDTDVDTAKKIWDVDRSLNVKASFYFRINNYDIDFMKLIENYGGEASYHYEELASYAKRKHIKDITIMSSLEEIRGIFKQNIIRLRNLSQLPLLTVASHGDFVNRKLNIPNSVFLEDLEFRKLLNIKLEIYDRQFMKYITSRHSDAPFPEYYKPNSPVEAISRGETVIYFLTHPRHWHTNVLENIKDNVKRLYEEIIY